jgi:hypothetical protein
MPLQPVTRRRARLVALAVGGFLLPWIAVLASTLPATAQAQHWALAWTGLDGAEAVAALATAALIARGDRRASLPAAAGGTLLLIDAWFDVCTSAPGTAHAMALAEAALAEIPLAVAAWWLAIALTRETDEGVAAGGRDRRGGGGRRGRGRGGARRPGALPVRAALPGAQARRAADRRRIRRPASRDADSAHLHGQ